MRRFCLKLISLIGIIILIAGCIPLSTAEENRTEFNPVRVSTLEAYARGKYSLYWDFMAQDNRGNLYADMLYSSMAPSDGNTYDLYDIDGKYLYFRGVVGAKYNNNGINDKYTAIIRIYGDDRLLFSDENITSTSKAYEIELDIRDVMDLKIEMYGQGNVGSNGIRAMLANPELLLYDPGFFDGAPDAPSPESYQSAADLSGFSPYQRGMLDVGEEENIKDSRGNVYPFGLRGFMKRDDGQAYRVYDIGGNYQFFTATVAPMYQKDGLIEGKTGIIRIYGDDRLLWSDEQINSTTRPYEITIYIGHVMDLKIEMYGSTGTGKVNPLLCNPRLLP